MIFVQIFKLFLPGLELGSEITKYPIKPIAVTNNIIQSMIAKMETHDLQDELKINFNLNEKYKNRNKSNKSSLPFM